MGTKTKADNKKGGLQKLTSDQLRTVKAKQKMIEALRMSMGIVTRAVGMVETSRAQYYVWLKEDSVFSAIVQEISEEAIDMVEGKMYQLINGVETVHPTAVNPDGSPVIFDTLPDKILIMFYLKTKAKHRGYIERTEVGITKAEPITEVVFKLK